jgi:hypothetical protein
LFFFSGVFLFHFFAARGRVVVRARSLPLSTHAVT